MYKSHVPDSNFTGRIWKTVAATIIIITCVLTLWTTFFRGHTTVNVYINFNDNLKYMYTDF